MSTPRVSAFALIVVLFPLGVWSAEITTSIVQPSSKSRTATLQAKRIDGAAQPLERPISVPGTTDMALPAGLWEIRIVGSGLWATPVYLRNGDSASIKIWPAVALTGTSNGVTALRARFRPLEPDGAEGEVDCDVDGQSWTCALPAGHYQLRFSSPGFAPELRFSVSVPADGAPSPLRLRFVRGASLSGSVEAVRGSKISIEGMDISLIPAGGENVSGKQVVRTDAKGFFQFKGLSPGDYSVRAASKGLAAQSRDVTILAGVAAELKAPLLLDTPKRLTVTVMPPLDPAGIPWTVQLISTDIRLRRANVIAESRISADGEWSHPALIAGDYEVQIHRASGDLWKSESIKIDRDDLTIGIAALAVRLTGVITLGDRPLQASLSFGGEGGAKLQSDADGRFTGNIPPDEGEERLILIEADTPRVKRSLRTKLERNESGELHVAIKLPATTLTGRVLHEDKSPEPHGIVTVTRNQPDVFEQTFTQPDGSFQIAGFEPGSYRVTADAFERMSKHVSIELRRDETADVELVLQKFERVRGRMTMGEVPTIAADIYAFPRDGWAPGLPHATTDEAGFFELDLPPGTTTFDGFVVHPAFDIMFGRTTIRKDKELRLRANQIGGTVIVDSTSEETLLLVHNGGEMTTDWLAYQTGGTVTPGRITVPRLEPGQYSACAMKSRACVSGYLPPHGTLTLTLTPASAAK